ncbi:MAG: exonuclease domain-containing protein [Gammaproteobacteria bacterium]
MKKTYLFYDIETSGLNKAFDQVLQFAAIRTDSDLNEMERHEIWVRLSADTIPSPGAVITHHITPEATAQGLPEIEAIVKIHQLLNMPGTISVGYNTLGFDDEFLRFSFYRNLLPPYTHQWANGCSRFDIAPLCPLYYLYKNECIKWPEDPDKPGKISLRLENLSRINQLADGSAHNAMVDVVATLELAKLLRQESEIWQYVIGFFDKNTVAERTHALLPAFTYKQQTFREGLFIHIKAGCENAYQAPVLALGNHNHYRNQMLWLRLDSEKLMQTTPATIPENTWVYKLKTGEANIVLPLTERFSRLSQERQWRVEQNKKWLEGNPDLFFAIMNYHKNYTYPNIPHVDIDAALYQNGFLSDDEQRLCAYFHAAHSGHEKAAYLGKLPENLRQQAVRIMGRNYPNCLPKNHAEEFAAYLRDIATADENTILIDYKGNKRLTPNAALTELQKLRNAPEMTKEKLHLLDELEKYLHKKFKE